MTDGVDPRFDPRFQRGYDPARHAVPHESAVPVRRDPPRAADPPRMVPQPPDRTAVEADPPDPAGEGGGRVDAAASEAHAEAEPDEAVPPPRNLPLLALPVVGVALLAGAVVVAVARASDPPGYGWSSSFGPADVAEQVWFMVGLQLPGPLAAAGALAFVAWAAVHAILRERR